MMEDGPFTPSTMFGTDNTMDMDLINELLYDGYWLHTAEGSEFWQSAVSSPSALNFSSSFVPSLETKTNDLNPSTIPIPFKEDTERLGFGSNPPPLEFPQMGEPAGNQEVNLVAASSGPSENFVPQNTEMNKTLWISPLPKATRASTLKDRLMQAIKHLQESTKDGDVLIQLWVPVKKGGRKILTTNDQPFSVTSNSKSLADYRTVSSTYEFSADENSKELAAGLPGRVFLKKLPEWTPDVRFFKTEEYPRVNYAQQYNVSGSLALPVFERGSGSCLGVVEIVTTTRRVNYRPELENVCRALEAVDLRSSDIRTPRTLKGYDESYQAVLAEIREVLKSVSDAHGLPLAQTWAPCFEQSKAGCRHSDENYTHCVSTVDSACYVRNSQVRDFHDACSEHHLIRGEGVVGGAFMTNQPCFASDITALTKTEYPLSHHARIFGLHAAVAIRLRSVYTGSADFVLEFFLPSECRDPQEQRHMLGSLSSVIQQVCRSLRVVTDQEIAEERSISERMILSSLPKESSQEESSWIAQMVEAQQKGKAVIAPSGYEKIEPEEEFKPTTQWQNAEREFHQDLKAKGRVEVGEDFSSFGGSSHLSGVRKSGEKRRTKTEKTISMEVLRQYFAGSLKDAAKSIGVCPTTLKRICRQHGITRWPSRKIKKVGHSLKKLQLVIDSVQGVEGSIQLSSFYSKFPELSSPGVPGTNSGSTTTVNDQLRPFNNTQADGSSLLSPVTNTSKSPSSSCSQSSSSSFSCPSEAKQPLVSVHVPGGDASLAEEQGLKRAHSETELHDSVQEETKLLVRSQSQKLFSEAQAPEGQALLPKLGSQIIREATGFRVKVIFGEENIRFRIPESYGFGEVQQEIGKRFNIDDTSKIDLKYLDDDNEWVLLTCDADLEECIDIHRSSKSRTIKLAVHQPSNGHLGSSFGSNGLS